MEFVTIHDLSRELNIPARVIRYRLIQLIATGKLKEHDDFRRDDFKDDQHFVWKIHPLRFSQETGLKPDVAQPLSIDNGITNEPLSIDNRADNHSGTPGVEGPKAVTHPVNQTGESSLTREMIDLLKDQIGVKDRQLLEQGQEIKQIHELNLKLTGALLQQGQKIENLMRLTGGKTELADVVTQESPPVDSGRLN